MKRASNEAPGTKPEAIFQLKITLKHISPPIWRRIVVPDDLSLGDLHSIIQAVMGWQSCHMHAFKLPARGFGSPRRIFSDSGEDEDEDGVILRHVFEKLKQVLIYEYDFGDGWEHQIVLEKASAPEMIEKPLACLGGARACPPEDCGGPMGYYEIIKAIEEPKRASAREVLGWLGRWEPEKFDLQAVNSCLGV